MAGAARTMGRPKRNPDGPPDYKQVGLRCSLEYADWLERTAAGEQRSVATLIERALAKYAAAEGYDAPPRRTP